MEHISVCYTNLGYKTKVIFKIVEVQKITSFKIDETRRLQNIHIKQRENAHIKSVILKVINLSTMYILLSYYLNISYFKCFYNYPYPKQFVYYIPVFNILKRVFYVAVFNRIITNNPRVQNSSIISSGMLSLITFTMLNKGCSYLDQFIMLLIFSRYSNCEIYRECVCHVK